MTTQPNDDHFKHAHLDGGRCLDGSGRTWDRDAAAALTERAGFKVEPWQRDLMPRVGPVELSLLLRRIDRLAGHVLLLSVAVLLQSIAVVLLVLAAVGRL